MDRRNKILILTSSFGEGHKSAAHNLKAGVEHVTSVQDRVVIVDPLERLSGFVNERAKRAYFSLINRIPLGYGLLFDDSQKQKALQDHMRSLKLAVKLFPVFENIIQEHRPDIICSVYPYYSELLKYLSSKGKLPPFRKVTLITDSITIHPAWLQDHDDTFFVPDHLSRNLLEERAVPKHQIKVCGFPVSPNFALERKNPLPLEEGHAPSILYIGNSSKEDIPDVLEKMMEADPSWNITLTGIQDEELTAKLQAFVKEKGQEHRVEVSNWTDKMPELLMTHHVAITKAGGATVNEAINACCPMIINKVIQGQEEGNVQLLRAKECLVAQVDDPNLIAFNLQRLFADDAALWHQQRESLKNLSHPTAAMDVAKTLLSMDIVAKDQRKDPRRKTIGKRICSKIKRAVSANKIERILGGYGRD